MNNDSRNPAGLSEGQNAFKLSIVTDSISSLLGEILTIVDASIEGSKNKAIKDLIKDKFNSKMKDFSEMAYFDSEYMRSDLCGYGWEAKLVPFDQEEDEYIAKLTVHNLPHMVYEESKRLYDWLEEQNKQLKKSPSKYDVLYNARLLKPKDD